jgi:integrase
MKLIEKTVRTLQLPPGKTDHVFWDAAIPGLGIRLRAGGSRGWVFQYRLGDKQRRLSLGSVTAESFRIIREQAAQLHARVKLGQDPAGDKTENRQRAGDTFEAIARKYLAAKKDSTRPGTYRETERHIVKHAKPLNGMPVANISRRDIANLIGSIKDNSGPVAANRVRSTLSDFFGWAMSEGIDTIESNPVIGTNKSEEKPRERVLRDHELRAIWKLAGDDHYGSIVRLLMLTGQRATEIGGLKWSEIDTGARTINLPGDRTKNHRPHVVPLSDPAMAILDSQVRRADGNGELRDFVFGIGQQGFSGWSRCKERLDERIAAELGKPFEPWIIHDLRRTAATLMNDRLGVLPHVVEAILNHVSGHKGGVAGIYNRAQYMRERTEALRLWADYLMSIVGRENNLVQLRRPA